MVHKFCENHLSQLYEAIKAGDILNIEKIEHELSPIEECVACAYALKAKGTARQILLEYLESQGFKVETAKRVNFLSSALFWMIRLVIFLLIFSSVFIIFRHFWPAIFSFIFAMALAIFAFVLMDQILGD